MTATATQPTNLAALRAPQEASMPAVRAGFFDLQSFELMQRIAKGFASSTLVPREYQNNVANCMIALNLAQRINGDPLMVMQNLVIVHGRPTWSSQYLIATANMCGRFTAIRFEFFGDRGADTWGCRGWAIEKSTGEKLVGADITIGIAKEEGWYSKNGSKWKSIPQQMLMYRAGSWWVRAYAPELSMGLMTADEAEDTFDLVQGTDGKLAVDLSALRDDPAGEHGEHPQIEERQPVTIPQQTAAPAAERVDAETGELIDRNAQQQSGDSPGFADAHAAVRSGDYDLARDLARGLPDAQRQQIEAAIANLDDGARQQQDAPARGRARQQRGQGGLGLD
ncbi:hypothetical protein [Pseudothauera rhizosphaerae]|uniref:RecT family protein n=1 Tax=Pseudothauera rhizosphaerae TaxID=2565932 RepID=A0A4S4A7N2_9RHOO|nr:hypothetical protein [Pseudothauera rhizosphaerae]THF54659.1 hypothetical protein E6O51_21585 [Pseudothauera rhizosphaerae]